MTKFEEKYNRKRYRASYGTTVISISLVLFVLGLMALMVFHANKLSDYVRENIGVSVMLKDEINNLDILLFKSKLDSLEYVKSTKLISKAVAAEKLKHELGEDFVDFLGYNPLPTTIVVFLHAGYTAEDSISKISENFLREDFVREVDYQKSMVELVNRNLSKVGMVLMAFSGILLVISVLLIYNTIRLAVFARRLLIKSMLLVGATQAFIRKPFIVSGIFQGLIGGTIAVILLAAILYLAQNKIPEITVLQDIRFISLIFAGVVIFGVLIAWFSNYFAVKKYLKFNSDTLY